MTAHSVETIVVYAARRGGDFRCYPCPGTRPLAPAKLSIEIAPGCGLPLVLAHTCIHLPQVGPAAESALWDAGVLTWDDFIDLRSPPIKKALWS